MGSSPTLAKCVFVAFFSPANINGLNKLSKRHTVLKMSIDKNVCALFLLKYENAFYDLAIFVKTQ